MAASEGAARRRGRLALGLALVGLQAGCTEYTYTERTAKDAFQQVRRNTVDVLMVVDNSCSMVEEQDNLASNFQAFIDTFNGVDVDWQIGVTTTDAADPTHSGHLLGGDDEIELKDASGRTIDRVAYDRSWPIAQGVALQLDPDARSSVQNDDVANWCAAVDAYGDGDKGTPGTPNGACGGGGPPPPEPPPEDTGGGGDTGGGDDTGSTSDAVAGPGDVLVTEFMADPGAVADALGEWVELSNLTDDAFDMSGWTLVDNGRNRFTFPEGTRLAAQGRLVVGRSTDTAENGGLPADVAVGPDFTLTNKILVLTSETEGAAEIFSEMVAVGTTGSGIEMGLEGARLATSEPLRTGDNAGFLRDDANLSIIFVSDENDYSPDPVDDYYVHFAGLKGDAAFRDHGLVNFSAVVGTEVPAYDGQPSCESENGAAYYGVRYKDLATRSEGALESICAEDFAPIARELGLTVSGLEQEFVLSEACNENTLVVKLYADQTEASFIRELVRDEDYVFVPEHNAIRFEAGHAPPSETWIVAEYDILESGRAPSAGEGS